MHIEAHGWRIDLLDVGALRMEPEVHGPAASEAWDCPVAALLLRREGSVVLVDAGSGLVDDWWPGAGKLDAALDAAGVAASAITGLVLTHLDFDHSGGVVAGAYPDALEPAFPGVPLTLLDERLDDWRGDDPDPDDIGTRIVQLFGERGLLRPSADGAELLPGLRLWSAPGHRAGHACVTVGDGAGRHVHLSDLVHHPDHVAHPAWDSHYDSDRLLALETRIAWLEAVADEGCSCSASHLPTFGRVVWAGDALRWAPLA